MLQDLVYSPTLEYRTGELYNPKDLYAELFENSIKGDLLLGYFSSTAIRVLSHSFSEFISNGGVLRVLANTVLSSDDLQLFENAPFVDLLDIDSLEEVYSKLSSSERNFFMCLRFLMNHDRIQFRFIQPSAGRGIAHFKSAIFEDANKDIVYSKGSCNFTASGLIYNLEEMSVSCSWESDHNLLRIDEFKKYYDQIWCGDSDLVKVADISRLKEWIDDRFDEISLEELVEFSSFRKNKPETGGIILDPETPFNRIKFPYESGPRDYQEEALKKWIENGNRGLFAMATGTGKTLTALNCVLHYYESIGFYRSVIVVPTSALMLQWMDQVSKFGFDEVYLYNNLTKIQSKTLELIDIEPEDSNYILIVSYSTFSKSSFQKKLSNLISHSIVIADEAHNSSSNKASKAFVKLDCFGMLGLSATPERRFDETDSFYERVFHSKFPHTFSFSMKTAIDSGILAPYKYYPIAVEMDKAEFDSYDKVTQSILQLTSRGDLSKEEKEVLKNLSIYRRSIINSASGKEAVTLNVLSRITKRQGDLRYTLIYVPVGYEKADEYQVEIHDFEHRIDRYSNNIRKSFPGCTIAQFTGGMKKEISDGLIESFESGRNQMLISMKCLDEGVDIPIAKNAIFISSSGSPREFIQRRGRVLRAHEDKALAHIYDLYVIPPAGVYPSSATRKIALDEITRLTEFAQLAINKAEVLSVISSIEKSYK